MKAWLSARGALVALFAAAVALVFSLGDRLWPSPWSAAERETLRSLWLASLRAPPLDPSNRYADDERAARLGAKLFRDARLSGNGRTACSHCHEAARGFADGRRLAEGAAHGRRNTPSVVPAAHGAWYFWDGRRDSQWAQALVPLEGREEQNGRRADIARTVAAHYRGEYEAVFGRLPPLPLERFPKGASPLGEQAEQAAWERMSPTDRSRVNRIFANVGKSLAAYQRTLAFSPSRFDHYVEAVLAQRHFSASRLLTERERYGLRLFIGRASCTNCHRGPLFTSFEFFSLGLPKAGDLPDAGRGQAFRAVEEDPFNCLGHYSDAPPDACSELRFMAHDPLAFFANFKTPSLRNVATTAPYMHNGQLESLEQVIDHYATAPRVPFPEHTDIQPVSLSKEERASLVAFLKTLSSPVNERLNPDSAAAAGSD